MSDPIKTGDDRATSTCGTIWVLVLFGETLFRACQVLLFGGYKISGNF